MAKVGAAVDDVTPSCHASKCVAASVKLRPVGLRRFLSLPVGLRKPLVILNHVSVKKLVNQVIVHVSVTKLVH